MSTGILTKATWLSGAEQATPPTPEVTVVSSSSGACQFSFYNGSGGPTSDVNNGVPVFVFEDGLTQPLLVGVRVPQNYSAGRQIKLRCLHYHEASSATQLLSSVTTLLELGDTVDSTTDQRTSTNTAQTGASKVLCEAIMDLTDSSGQVNGNAVAAGDWLLVSITRGTDTSTADINMIKDSVEVTF